MHITLLLQLVSAWRSTRAAWRHALLSTALLAFGIAATVTVFALVKVMLIDPLPYRDQDQLVHVHESRPPEFPRFAVAPGKFAMCGRRNRAASSRWRCTRVPPAC